MKPTSTALVSLLFLVSANAQTSSEEDTPTTTDSASGQAQTVQVGENGLQFEPSSITANEGDVVEFVIYSGHNVARSSFESPCQPIEGSQAIWTGSDISDGTVFSVTINDTNPVWLYCATQGHCQRGMAMVINLPSSGDTLEAYQSAAAGVSSSGSPTDIAGGVFDMSSDAEPTTTEESSTEESSTEESSTEESSTEDNGATSSASGGSESTSSAPGESTTAPGSRTASPTTGTTATSATASPATSSNAARNLFAEMMMLGGTILAGSVILM